MVTRLNAIRNSASQKDHPHAYGDKNVKSKLGWSNAGSSPRVWGQVYQYDRIIDVNRIIPTRMGTRLESPPDLFANSDHPHAYGDKTFLKVSRRSKAWIIPTRMGTRFRNVPFCLVSRDHPHAYGDKIQGMKTAVKKKGSSTCVWGQEPLEVQLTNGYRIIPMRVGTSCKTKKLVGDLEDHPHACGDKSH